MKIELFDLIKRIEKEILSKPESNECIISKDDLTHLIHTIKYSEQELDELKNYREKLEACITTVEAIFGGEILSRI